MCVEPDVVSIQDGVEGFDEVGDDHVQLVSTAEVVQPWQWSWVWRFGQGSAGHSRLRRHTPLSVSMGHVGQALPLVPLERTCQAVVGKRPQPVDEAVEHARQRRLGTAGHGRTLLPG